MNDFALCANLKCPNFHIFCGVGCSGLFQTGLQFPGHVSCVDGVCMCVFLNTV
jgi:hypothetical protein